MTTASIPQGGALPTEQPPRMGRLPFGVVGRFQRDPLGLYTEAMQQYRDLVVMKFGPADSWAIFHPDYVKRILVDNHKNYIRNRTGNGLLKLITGENLLTSDGDFWLRQRRLMQPAFHRQRILGFGQIMADKTQRMMQAWEIASANGSELDIAKEMASVTLAIVTQSLFSQDLSEEANELGHSIQVASEYFAYRLGHVLAPPLWLPTPRNRHFKRVMAANAQRVPNMIAARRRLIAEQGTAEATGRQYDMMDLLLDARYEDTGEPMSDEQLTSETRILISAGHETTANSLTWTLYLLTQHPAVEARVRAEIDSVLQGRAVTLEELPKLTYTQQVLQEAMRLYPAAWAMARQSIHEDQLGPYRLPADQGVVMSIYSIHRHPDFWEQPDRFDPDRFEPQRAAQQHKFAYFPFGGGPRQCIGNVFALSEAQLILASIVQRYTLRLRPGYVPTPQALVTLRPRDGMPMTVQPRA